MPTPTITKRSAAAAGALPCPKTQRISVFSCKQTERLTYFRGEITYAVKQGENLAAVKPDTTENPAVPPDFVIDCPTYGGLYRDVRPDIRPL